MSGLARRLLGVRVLVVDDNLDTNEITTAVLEQHGATVSQAGTATAALEILRRERPNVLISDLQMPIHDGYWLIDQVRHLTAADGRDTPAAALTGCSGAEDRARVLRAGFQFHIPKPVTVEQLVGVVGILAAKH